MKITGTELKYCRPPLPFVGNKRLFMNPFCNTIKRFKGRTVLDVFGGSGLLSRYTKDTNPNLDVTLNDISDYSQRLAVVEDTNEILHRLRAAGAYRSNNSYVRYPKEVEDRLKAIVEDAKDYETAHKSVYVKASKTVRALCRTVDYDVDLCAHWYDGLNRISNEIMDCVNNTCFLGYDLIILDPPYKTKPTKCLAKKNDYTGDAKAARDFCEFCIKNAASTGAKIILFDEIDSVLINMFISTFGGKHFSYIPATSHKGVAAKDMMITNIV